MKSQTQTDTQINRDQKGEQRETEKAKLVRHTFVSLNYVKRQTERKSKLEREREREKREREREKEGMYTHDWS